MYVYCSRIDVKKKKAISLILCLLFLLLPLLADDTEHLAEIEKEINQICTVHMLLDRWTDLFQNECMQLIATSYPLQLDWSDMRSLSQSSVSLDCLMFMLKQRET